LIISPPPLSSPFKGEEIKRGNIPPQGGGDKKRKSAPSRGRR